MSKKETPKTNTEAPKPKRVRTYALELYNEWENVRDIIKTLEARAKKIAYITHDCDVNDDGTPKKSHIHVWLTQENACTKTALAKLLGIEERFIQHVNNDTAYLRYLFHLDDPDKFQYPREAVTANFDLSYIFRTEKNEGEIVLELIEEAYYHYTRTGLIRYAVQNNMYDVLRRNWSIIMSCVEDEHKDKSRLDNLKRARSVTYQEVGRVFDENGVEVVIVDN